MIPLRVTDYTQASPSAASRFTVVVLTSLQVVDLQKIAFVVCHFPTVERHLGYGRLLGLCFLCSSSQRFRQAFELGQDASSGLGK